MIIKYYKRWKIKLPSDWKIPKCGICFKYIKPHTQIITFCNRSHYAIEVTQTVSLYQYHIYMLFGYNRWYYKLDISLSTGVRANIHLWVKLSFARMANTNCLSRGPAREKKKNELLQFLFFDGRRVVHDERLLCYPIRNVSQVDGYLFRSVTQLVKQMCCVLPK